jgi:hypothetical protein
VGHPPIGQAACRNATGPVIAVANKLGAADMLSSGLAFWEKFTETTLTEAGKHLAETTVSNLRALLTPSASGAGIASADLPGAALNLPSPSWAVKYMSTSESIGSALGTFGRASGLSFMSATVASITLSRACGN